MLWAAVLRTDNATRKVRASLATLAKDAGYQPNAATGVFADANEPVMRYFEKVERHPRRTDLWFQPSNRLTLRVSHAESEPPSDGARLTLRVSTTHAESDPSASLCSTSASPTSPLVRPSDLSDEQAEDTATPAGPLTTEPLSQQGQAPEVEEGEKKPCGCTPGLSCPTCRGDVVRPQKHPDFRLKGWHDDHLERDEKLNEYGEPLGLDY